jgi:hypothetical protein
VNLLKETIDYLAEHSLAPNDVEFVKSGAKCFTWETFSILADKEYDDGYGVNEVCLQLKIVGKSFWLERREYYGSEWWEFKEQPKFSEIELPVKSDVWEG